MSFDYSFDESSNHLTIIDGTTEIPDREFFYWERFLRIESVAIPDSVEVIGSSAFGYCDLTEVIIPNSVTEIGTYAFTSNELTEVVIGDSVITISEEAFNDNSLTEVVIGDSVTTIGEYAFANNSLTEVVIPDSVTEIGRSAFASNELTEVVIPDSVTEIGSFAFGFNSLEKVSVSDRTLLSTTHSPATSIDSFGYFTDIFVRDFYDDDADGFVDNITNYQMWYAFGGVDLTNRRGRTYSDNTSTKWDAVKAVETDSGFLVLVEGHLSKESKYKVVSADDEGVISRATRWLNGNQMFDSGYEEIFSMDFNGNGVVDLV